MLSNGVYLYFEKLCCMHTHQIALLGNELKYDKVEAQQLLTGNK